MFNMARESCKMDAQSDLEKEEESFSSNLELYEAQFFGFTPETCMLRIQSAFVDCLVEILPVVEKVCVRQLCKGEAEDEAQARVRDCTRKLHQFLTRRFEQMSERMEGPLVNRCLSIPANVLLPEDRSHKKYPDAVQEMQRLESSLAHLQGAYEAEVGAKQALLEELEEQKEVQKQLDGYLLWVQELQGAWVTEGSSSYQESLELVMKSVKNLQEVLKEVCSQVPE